MHQSEFHNAQVSAWTAKGLLHRRIVLAGWCGPAVLANVQAIETQRLILRRPEEHDFQSIAEMNADARVMRFFPSVLDRDASREMFERVRAHFDEHGFGFFAVEEKASGLLAGLTGLAVVGFSAPFAPAIEIGWRLRYDFQGKGFAAEAAAACLRSGFEMPAISEIVSFTVPHNTASRRVMEKIGMKRDPGGDFDHPRVSAGHPLCRHVLYRILRPVQTG